MAHPPGDRACHAEHESRKGGKYLPTAGTRDYVEAIRPITVTGSRAGTARRADDRGTCKDGRGHHPTWRARPSRARGTPALEDGARGTRAPSEASSPVGLVAP